MKSGKILFVYLMLWGATCTLSSLPDTDRAPLISNSVLLKIAEHVLPDKSFDLYLSDKGRCVAVKEPESGKVAGFFVVTSDYFVPSGYLGPTVVGLTLDLDGSIASARILKSADTRAYVQLIIYRKFMDRFKGMVPDDEFDLDAVTRATVTCDAITQSVSRTMVAFKRLRDAMILEDGEVVSDKRELMFRKFVPDRRKSND